MKTRESIVLLGYMGSGKTTLGKVLANQLGYRFLDLDQELVAHLGTSVRDFIETKGELAFRKAEHAVLLSILDQHQEEVVLALGGGTPCFYDHMTLLNAWGHTVYLEVSVKELARRLEPQLSERPLLKASTDLMEFVAKHLFERGHFYAEAKQRITDDQLTVEKLVSLLEREV